MASAADVVLQAWAEGWEAPPRQTVDQWADTHRVLDSKASAEPGRWRTDRTPFLREIMQRLSPNDPCQRVVFMKGAQIGGTESGNNWIGHTIMRAPAPMLMVQPTVELAKRVSKQRLGPMIEASEELARRITDGKSRDNGNTTFVKEFPGGLLILTGSNSGAGLRSMPIAKLFCDEVDEYPGDVDGQGDPIALAEKRTTTFSRRKILLVSTPTVKGLSRIEREYERSDQRRYFVPCPECGHEDWLRWENLRYEKGEPESARMLCVACGALTEERHKTAMLAAGHWRPTKPGNGTLGYHLSSLYSPVGWKSWAECVAEWEEAQTNPMLLKTFVNTVLGETYEERGDSLSADGLAARKERYSADLPEGVGALTCSVDTQGDRLEVKVKGWGAMEESWLVGYHTIPGDPGQTRVWEELAEFLKLKWKHVNGREFPLDCTVIDSGGHHTEAVYRFAKTHERAFAIRGGGTQGFLMPPSRANAYRIPLFTLNVTAGKDVVFSRLMVGRPGPGYCHFPEWADEEYFAQLTAEKAIRKWVKGRGSVKEYVKTRERNEALDLEVYALAALHMLGERFVRSLPERAAAWGKPPDGPAGPPPTQTLREAVAAARRPRGSWVNRW